MGRVESARGRREPGGVRPSGHVRAAVRVDRDRQTLVRARPAQERRVGEARVDHERSRVVVPAELEAVCLVAPEQPVTAFNRDLAAVYLLPGTWLRVANRSEWSVDQKAVPAAQRNRLRAGICEADAVGLRARLQKKLVLELSAGAAETHVDAGPEPVVGELPIGGQAALPSARVIAPQVVDRSFAALLRYERGAAARSEEAQIERLSASTLLHREHSLLVGEVEAEAVPLRVIADAFVRLAAVRDE